MTSVALTAAFVAGVLLLSFGAWLAYEPSGFIVLGAVLVLVPLRYVRGGLA